MSPKQIAKGEYPNKPSALTSLGVVASEPSEIYGNEKGPVVFRLGNGGSGPTGILRRLAEDFLSMHAPGGAIPWVCNHSRNIQLALHHGFIDLAMTYERSEEATSYEEGWAVNAGLVFHDHFVVAGPRSNPINLSFDLTPAECFIKIAEAGSAGRATFHSRNDGSATNIKEQHIWSLAGLAPWKDPAANPWYKKIELLPAAALMGADKAGAFLLNDRSTLLRQTADETIENIAVYYEPKDPEDVLMNGCVMTTAPSPPPETTAFVTYAKSDRAQEIVKNFGTDATGAPFFARVDEGFAKPVLRGGFPKDGRWQVLGAESVVRD